MKSKELKRNWIHVKQYRLVKFFHARDINKPSARAFPDDFVEGSGPRLRRVAIPQQFPEFGHGFRIHVYEFGGRVSCHRSDKAFANVRVVKLLDKAA